MAIITIKRSESSIQGAVVGWAKKTYGIVCQKLSTGSRFQKSSFPDFIFFLPGGKPLLIEFKREGGIITSAQADNHAGLRGLGYDVCVVDDVETGKRLIREAMEKIMKKKRKST